ncbi:MAG: hypothetical protein JWO69_530 [Thermoleophilia bacterium]|jgi:hypothetical protein|nr:hypothetical protein [Thermoleophilia bacterium]
MNLSGAIGFGRSALAVQPQYIYARAGVAVAAGGGLAAYELLGAGDKPKGAAYTAFIATASAGIAIDGVGHGLKGLAFSKLEPAMRATASAPRAAIITSLVGTALVVAGGIGAMATDDS